MQTSIMKSNILNLMPMLPVSASFSCGILLAKYWQAHTVTILICALIIFLLLFLAHRNNNRLSFILILLVCTFILGNIRYAIWQKDHLAHQHLAHLPLALDQFRGEVLSVREGQNHRAVIALDSLRCRGEVLPASGKVLLYLPDEYSQRLRPGAVLICRNTVLEKLPALRNPGQFDYGNFLSQQGISARAFLRRETDISLLTYQKSFSLEAALFYPLRKYLERTIEQYLPASSSGFLQALLLGIRDDLSQATINNFQKAGVIHALAISGLHVGFIAFICHTLLSFFPLFFKTRNLITIICLIFYMALTGGHPPVVRATIMAGFFLIAINLERQQSGYNYLYAAGFIILLYQPAQLFRIGFQFSFAAVLSILYFYHRLSPLSAAFLNRFFREKYHHRLNKWLITPFLVSLAAQIGTAPLVLYYFNIFSPVAFFLNLLVIPWVGLLTAGGFLFLALSSISETFAMLLGDLLTLYINTLDSLVHFAAAIPGAYFYIPGLSIPGMLAYLFFILALFHFQHTRLRFLYTISFLLILGFILIQETMTVKALDLIAIDVGQGDALLLTTPAGKTIMIDTGPAGKDFNSADRAIIPLMQHLGIKKIDYLFLSHPHLDHIGGLFHLSDYAEIDSVYLPPLRGTDYYWQDSLCTMLDASGIPRRFLSAGEIIPIDDATRVYTLGPFPLQSRLSEINGENINNNSLTFLLRHRAHSLLFTGDAEAEAENYLLHWRTLLKSEILKVGHHGSETSTGEDFLAEVAPKFALISAGRNNRYGHPDRSVLQKLRGYNVRILRTDLQGAIWLRLSRGNWRVIDWR